MAVHRVVECFYLNPDCMSQVPGTFLCNEIIKLSKTFPKTEDSNTPII